MKKNYSFKQQCTSERPIFAQNPLFLTDEEERGFKGISNEFSKKFVLFRGPTPDTLAYHRLMVLCDSTSRDIERCCKTGLSICKYAGAFKWLRRARQTYCDLYNGLSTSDNVEFDELMYNFFSHGGVL